MRFAPGRKAVECRLDAGLTWPHVEFLPAAGSRSLRARLLPASRLILTGRQSAMRIGSPRTERERIAAVRCLFGATTSSPTDDSVHGSVDQIRTPAIESQELVAVWRQHRPLAVTMFRIATDGTACLWAPEVAASDRNDATLADAVLREATSRIDAADCQRTLSVVQPQRQDQGRALLGAGFACAGSITSFQHTLADRVSVASFTSLPRVPYLRETESRFVAIVERTFEESRDCQRKQWRQTGRSLLESYAASPGSTPHRWSILVHESVDVAVMLVNECREDRSWEIAYLGVIPERRRRGIAHDLVGSLLDEAARTECGRVVTTAHDDNLAATSLYLKTGFVARDRNVGYVRLR